MPSLREALALDEQGGSGDGDDAMNSNGAGDSAANKKGKKGRGKGKASVDEEKEKMDGRAGPRSENVVLVKSESLYPGSSSDV